MNELLGWGQLLSGATICDQANGNFKSRPPLTRCAFANCKRVPRQELEQAEQGKAPRTRRRSQAHCQCKNRFGEDLSWPNLTPELSRTALRPWASENQWYLHEAAKRARLERIVRLRHFSRSISWCTQEVSPLRNSGQYIGWNLALPPIRILNDQTRVAGPEVNCGNTSPRFHDGSSLSPFWK